MVSEFVNRSGVFHKLKRLPYWPLASLAAGILTTLAFAPFNLSWLVFFTVGLVLYLWVTLSTKHAVISAWLFSLGLQCSGVSWIYYSLHVHGSAPAFFAIILVLLLCCYLSIYAALAVYVVNSYLPNSNTLRLMIFYPASWVVFEWLQGYVMTGFSWMQLGYTQIDMPLSGFAAILGNHAISGIIVVSAGALVLLFNQRKTLNLKRINFVVLPVLVIWSVGAWLKPISWTYNDGPPLRVSVIQGNIAQKDKWNPQIKAATLKMYRDLSLLQRDVDLIVWPETAVPDYRYRMSPYLELLGRDFKARGTDILLGIFVKNDDNRVLNSVLNVNGGVYQKRHLVPLGEYIPLRFLIEFFNKFVKIPMSDIASGDEEQELLVAAGIPLGVSICFEEAFSRDVIRDLPEAKLLVNVSNDAWFEDSHEPHQHHAIARMRALETGRYMIRSTNTGVTSLIGPHGEVIKQLPQFEQGILQGEVQPLSGSTPYVRWGDWLIISLCTLLLAFFAVRGKKCKIKLES